MGKNGNKRPSFVAVLEDDNSQLSCTEYDVYVALLSYADSAGMAWPSHKGIQKRMRKRRDRRTVMRALRRLEELGKLEVQYGIGPVGTNVYTFTAATAAHAAVPPEGRAPIDALGGRATMHALGGDLGGRANGARGEGIHSVPSEVHTEVQEEKRFPKDSHSNSSKELVASTTPVARESYLTAASYWHDEQRAREQRNKKLRERWEREHAA